MTWHNVRGHDRVVEQFRRALARGRMASTFLFVGPPGIGKRTFALRLAQALLCDERADDQLDPCERCPSCLQVAALSHPDVELLRRPPDKAFIPVESLIGDKEHRMREGLCYNISLKPYSGRRKIAIIDDADYLNKEGANCLLKTLEEPPPKSILILIGTSEQRQLPTIRSRCQVVRFQALAEQDLAELLVEHGVCTEIGEARRAAALGKGSFAHAVQAADPQFCEFRGQLLELLSQREFELLSAAKMVSQFVDDAGKEAPAKRARLKEVIAMAADFYRQLLHAVGGAGGSDDPVLDRAVVAAQQWWSGDEAAIATSLEHCLDAVGHIEANVGQANLIEWWLDELATISRTGSPTAI